MKINIEITFRILYIIGLILLFLSMFLDWYYVQVFNNQGKLIASWGYNPFIEWYTISNNDNTIIKPKDLLLPIIIHIIFLITICLSGYTALFNDVENKKDLEKLYPYSYINFFLVVLNLYYIFAFPLFYLIPNDLYFPFMKIKNNNLDVTYVYSIGPGYILQVVSFLFIFPYAIFYYKTIENFKTKEHSAKKVIDKYIKQSQEPLDLDKLITQEELKIKFNDLPIQEEEILVNKITKKR